MWIEPMIRMIMAVTAWTTHSQVSRWRIIRACAQMVFCCFDAEGHLARGQEEMEEEDQKMTARRPGPCR
jgi:hypothetical protein